MHPSITSFLKGTCAGLMVTLYPLLLIPLSIYIGNIEEFSISIWAVLKPCILVAILAAAVVGIVTAIVPERFRLRFLAVVAMLSLLCWAQSYILVWDYGVLDGRKIDWQTKSWRGWLDSGLWIGLIVVALLASREFGKTIIGLAAVILLLQVALIGVKFAGASGNAVAGSHAAGIAEARQKTYGFSKTKNVLHIVADGFQSDVFEELLADANKGKRRTQALSGFTFFKEHLGAFPYTHMSVPAIVGGEIYKNHTPIKEHLKSTVATNSLFTVLNDNGYDVDIITMSGILANIYSKVEVEDKNLYVIPPFSHLSEEGVENFEAAKLLDFSLFRMAPHYAKRLVNNNQLWLFQNAMSDVGYLSLDFFRDISFLFDVTEKMHADRQEPVYKYMHLMLSHNPMVANPDCSYAGSVLGTVRRNVKVQSGCSLDKLISMFTKMKKLGIYDDAYILITADHGAWVRPNGLTGPAIPNSDKREVVLPTYSGLSLPLLAIKKPGESGSFKTSSAPTWIPDVPATVADVLGIKHSFSHKNVFDIAENEKRDRSFFFYQYNRREWNSEYLEPIAEMRVMGPAKDRASWSRGAIHLPGSESQSGEFGPKLFVTESVDP